MSYELYDATICVVNAGRKRSLASGKVDAAGTEARIQSGPLKNLIHLILNCTGRSRNMTQVCKQTKERQKKKDRKIQLSFSWKHLISSWKLKFYVNQLSAWSRARSQGAALSCIQISCLKKLSSYA